MGLPRKEKQMKKNGFTLIEILISLAIIAALAGVSIPAIYNNVVKIEQASTVESAMNGLRQFFVDARARSVKNEELFTLTYSNISLEFEGSRHGDILYYTLPSGLRTDFSMDITPSGTFSYLLGLFLKDNSSEYGIEKNFKINIKSADDTPFGTLTIVEGLPVLEF